MKNIVSILLILITAFYVLPVSDGFLADAETTSKCIDKSDDDVQDTKKDNVKEFIAGAPVSTFSKNYIVAITILPLLSALPVHFTIETPPPDQA